MNLEKFIDFLKGSDNRYARLISNGLKDKSFSIDNESALAPKEQLARTYRIRLKRFSLNKSAYAKELIDQTNKLCQNIDKLKSESKVYGLNVYTDTGYEYRVLYLCDGEILGILKFMGKNKD